jgi:regulator of sirC expression with transglutaminase-like and TPR domain
MEGMLARADAENAHRRAIVDYDRAIELGLEDARVHHSRGIAYEELGEYERALADYWPGDRAGP